MTITFKYDRKDFFGRQQYTEDTITARDADTAKKALCKCFSKLGTYGTIGISYGSINMVIFTETRDEETRDEESSGVVTVRFFEGSSYDESKKSKAWAKAYCNELANGIE